MNMFPKNRKRIIKNLALLHILAMDSKIPAQNFQLITDKLAELEGDIGGIKMIVDVQVLVSRIINDAEISCLADNIKKKE